MGRKVDILKQIREFDGDVSVCRKWLSDEARVIQKHFKSIGKSPQSIVTYFTRFMEANYYDNLLERCLAINSLGNSTATIDRYILYYGEQIGNERWESYKCRQAYTNSREYKNMSIDEFSEYNRSRANTLDNTINRHGECKGVKVWSAYVERQRYTTSLEYFIEKYGAEGHTRYKYTNFLKKHSLDTYIYKFGADDGLRRYVKLSKNRKLSWFSNIASELFKEIDDRMQLPNQLYYQPKTKEFGKMNMKLGKYTFFDFVIPDMKICIEFNGDVFHANPERFEADDTPNPFNTSLTSADIWEHDKEKNRVLLDEGYYIIIVWESDYRRDPESMIEYIIGEINENATV